MPPASTMRSWLRSSESAIELILGLRQRALRSIEGSRMAHKDNANWISDLAGKPVQPPRRETLQDLIDSRPFWASLADLTDLPAGIELHEEVLLWDRGETRLTAEIYVPEGTGPFPLLMHIHGGGY